MAGQPNSYSDGGLIRGSVLLNIPDSGNTSANVNYIAKDLSPNASVRSAYEYDQNGQPFASSHVRDFKKFSATIMSITNTNAPAQMTKFPAALYANNSTNTNYIITTLANPQTTEGLKSWTIEATEVIN